MKLYTEEQVIETFSTGVLSLYKGYIEERLETLTPIELPSEQEIEKALPDGFPHSDGYDAGKICGFEEGAKWMKEQILNQNK